MAGQTTVNGKTSSESPAQGVGRNLSGLIHDLLSLCELQGKLISHDVQEGIAKAPLPLLLIGSGAVLALATLPVMLIGLAWALAYFTEIALWGAFLIVGALFLAAAAAAVIWGGKRLKHVLGIFVRSRCELEQNIDWVKRALLQQAQQGDFRNRCPRP